MPLVLEIRRFFRFGLAAGAATVVHLSVAGVLVALLGSPLMVANMLAFLPAVVVSYISQRKFAFQAQGSPLRFLGVALAGFVTNNLVLLACTRHGLPVVLSLLSSVLGSPLLTYLALRNLVFRRRPAAPAT